MSTRIRTNCPRDCYDNCGIIVELRDGAQPRVLGDPDHPVSLGRLCSKCAVAYNGVWQDEAARLTRPLRRTGPKGSGRFEPISWDEACREVAERFSAIIERDGAQAILHTHYSGTLSLIAFMFPNRLFNCLGATEVDPDSICNAAGHVAWTLQFGSSIQGFDPRTAQDASAILVWGANPSHSAPHAHERWLQDTPARVVVVDPIRTETAAAADLHLQLRPGTDAALAFSLLHCLERDGRFDAAFIAAHTLGFEEIRPAIAAATPAWGERATGVPAADIEAAARIYGAGPALLWAGQGLQRQPTGGNVMRAIGLLPALTGNVGKPGAGFYYLNITPIFAGIDLGWLGGADLAKVPPPKISHMDLATRLGIPDEFKAFVSWNTNPLASAPRQEALRAACAREDLFTVAIDCFPTDTTRYADIVLPAAGFLEFDDLTFSYFHLHLGVQAKVREPIGEALPNQEIFRRLAHALGRTEAPLFADDTTLIETMLRQTALGFDFTEFKRRGYVALGDKPQVFYADRKFETPSGRIEIASAQAEEMGLPRTPQPWADGPPAAGHLRLLTPASRWRLNDSYANDAHLQAQAGPARVHLHPDDARRAGIADGGGVRLANECGSLDLLAHYDASLLPGTAVAYKGRWPLLEPNGANVNYLYGAARADMGESTAVHGTEVTITPVATAASAAVA